MKTVAFVAQKGGAGKTTLAAHVAYCAAVSGLKVALIDLDPQGSLFDWNESRKPDREFDAVRAGAKNLAVLLQQGAAAGVDLTIVDTAPHAAADAAIAAQLAHFVVVPCRPARFDLKAIGTTLEMLKTAATPYAVVINAAPHGFRLAREARAALAELGAMVLDDVVPQFAALAHAVIDGGSVHEYEPGGSAAAAIDRLYHHITRLCFDRHRRGTRRGKSGAAA